MVRRDASCCAPDGRSEGRDFPAFLATLAICVVVVFSLTLRPHISAGACSMRIRFDPARISDAVIESCDFAGSDGRLPGPRRAPPFDELDRAGQWLRAGTVRAGAASVFSERQRPVRPSKWAGDVKREHVLFYRSLRRIRRSNPAHSKAAERSRGGLDDLNVSQRRFHVWRCKALRCGS